MNALTNSGVFVFARTTALNVDVAVLYASSILAESSKLSKGRTLPGSYPQWRLDTMLHSKVLHSILRIYVQRAKKEQTILTTLLTLPHYLQIVASRSAILF